MGLSLIELAIGEKLYYMNNSEDMYLIAYEKVH